MTEEAGQPQTQGAPAHPAPHQNLGAGELAHGMAHGSAGAFDTPLPVLAAGLVHEVKNPLSAIHLHLQLLENQVLQVENDELRDQMTKRVDIIKREILGLNQILQDFIRLIRSESKTIAAQGLNEIVSQVVQLLSPQAARLQIMLQFRQGKVPDSLHLDPVFVKQTLINLVLNSVQAFAEVQDNRDRRVTISTGIENGTTFLRVEDNGQGILPEDQGKIFEPFFTTKHEGSGLGLSLVRKMITEMGGTVDVVSSPGKGTIFTLYFGGQKTLPGQALREAGGSDTSESADANEGGSEPA